MDRRTFLAQGSALVASAFAPSRGRRTELLFPDADLRWKRTWDAALVVLAGNVKVVPGYADPVLLEGAVYPGIWQECAPQEGLVYGTLARYVTPTEGQPTPMQIARNNHMAFFSLQKPDGQLPCSIKMSATGYGQIQMVVPIAATAWEVAQLTHDEQLLNTAYLACSRWDAWLRQYRDTRKTGLTEGFCVYDTGHDNSPRWTGTPKQCPHGDARFYDRTVATLPRLCPDLSATTYGGRVALAGMAAALGRKDEADRWQADAETIRHLILEKLYDPKDAAFYDLDAQGNFVRVRSDVIIRVLGEHVLKLSEARDRTIFEAVWTRQMHNPKAFWAPYPFPSIALDDPAFVRPIPRNSWGGATQALTALRAPRWMTHYGKQVELDHLMYQWCEAISRYTEFRQQMDPLTGDFTRADASGYSPAALAYLDFMQRLRKSAGWGRA
jgi:hypothetical protein